jgi:hypothetical protein
MISLYRFKANAIQTCTSSKFEFERSDFTGGLFCDSSKTTEIYTHVIQKKPGEIINPLDATIHIQRR